MSISEPIAIVGLGGILPGAATLDDFWNVVKAGVDTASEPPSGRWLLDLEQAYDPERARADHVYSRRACFVRDFQLERTGLNLPPELLDALDPMVHLALHAGRQAWRDAVTDPVDPKRVGVMLGNIVLPTMSASAMADWILGRRFEREVFRAAGIPMPPEDRAPVGAVNRWVAGLPAAVLARALGLGGDRFCLDAACASSLFAVELAVDALRDGRLDAVLAGGLSRPDSLYTQMGFSQLLAVSPTGRCSPFDHKSDGLVVGEGAGVLVLKRLSDAIEHGDRVRAVVKSVGLSNDVEGSLLAPSQEGQLRAMRGAYQAAGWQPSEVDLVECHATGTPVGDAVEFASLQALWAEEDAPATRCVIGSAKSNTGHLLTGAGAVGLLKTILAMEHKTLPPTANFEEAGDSVDLAQSPFRVLQEAQPWQAPKSHARRAAVSGFGFGGTNAHVLLEEATEPAAGRAAVTVPALPRSAEPKPESPESPTESPTESLTYGPEGRDSPSTAIAIVGMAARIGPWKDLAAVQQRILGRGDDHPVLPKENHWGVPDPPLGWFIEELEIPFGLFKIPPKEIEEALPQQMLMLQVAERALADAALDDLDRLRTGVFVGVEIDLNTTNYHLRWAVRSRAADWARRMARPIEGAEFESWVEELCDSLTPALNANRTIGGLGSIVASRVAREFGLGGPSYVLASEETSGMSALQAALRSLQTGRLDCAVVGAVDLSGDVRALLSLASTDGVAADGIPRPFHGESQGVVPSDGAVALVLKREKEARQDGDRIYAIVRGVGSVGGDLTDASTEAALRSCRDASVAPEAIPYVEGHGGGAPREDRAEARALAEVHGADTILGCTKARVGHTGAAAGLVSVLGASLALYQQVLPAAGSDWTGRGNGTRGGPAREPESRQGLIPLADSRPWVCDRAEGPRRAGVLAVSRGGSCSHVVLEESGATVREEERATPLGALPEGLFLVEGDDDEAVVAGLRQLAEFVTGAGQPITDAEQNSGSDGTGVSDLAQLWWMEEPLQPEVARAIALVARDAYEIESLARTAADQIEAGGDPSDRSAGRVFFTREPLGREGRLAFVYPGSGSQFAGMGRELCLQWPEILRDQEGSSEMLSSQLRASEIWRAGPTPTDARTVILSQVALGTLATDLMARFAVKPDAVIGYSLGETAGLFSTGAWHERDEMLRRTTESDLFETQLTGPCTAARAAWSLDEDAVLEWRVGVVDRSAEEVRAVLDGRERVYLLIVNTPDECVIGGDAEAVHQAVEALGSAFHELRGVTTVHCEVAQEVADDYRDLHLLDTRPPEGVRFYSGASGVSYDVDRESAADSLLAQALHGVDFPKTVRQAYEDGARIFLEMGPGASCTRMISKILDGSAFRARSISSPTQDEPSAVLRALAMLLVERVEVDLGLLYPGAPKPAGESKPAIRVPIGQVGFGAIPVGPSVADAAVTAETSATETMSAEDPSVAPVTSDSRSAHLAAQGLTAATASEPLMSLATESSPDLAAAVRAAETTLEVHEAFLRSAEHTRQLAAAQLAHQHNLLHALARGEAAPLVADLSAAGTTMGTPALASTPPPPSPEAMREVATLPRSVALDRDQLMEFAVGSIGKALGERFAHVDSHPTRVRLPDEPLMLVDRVLTIEAEPQSMTSGRIVTEHDVLEGAWYLDGGLIPTCVAVEAGQADLLLSGYLGIDSETQGLAVYRLLDAVVTFQGELPRPGQVIVYDIRIIHFFRQGDTWLFRFQFDATVDDRPLMTMREGSAGFFSQGELDAGKGIVLSALERREIAGQRPADWRELVPMCKESFDEGQIEALRQGDLAGAFGEQFDGLGLIRPLTIPGDRMRLVHRVTELDPEGGRYGIGSIVAEADIHPDDWFLTCHFVDDQVMPGTLMYECCLHTLRIFLLRMGWMAAEGSSTWQPIKGVKSRLRCRGQVLASTAMVTYEINVREMGYGPEPYAIVDAMMYADGKPIVDIREMSVQLTGADREQLEDLWLARNLGTLRPAGGGAEPVSEAPVKATAGEPEPVGATSEQSVPDRGTPSEMTIVDSPGATPRVVSLRRDSSVPYDKASILAFSSGKPSHAFGEIYSAFDRGPGRIARLPRPPYQFMDRVTSVEGEPFAMKAGAKATAQFDVTADHWYFASNRQQEMPFAVLLEVALQPCGWLAGYVGSALAAETDVRFRNLGGDAVQLARPAAGPDVITTEVELTSVSMSGGMIIQHYSMALASDRLGPLYEGTTYFGFFSERALADQVGIRDATIYAPSSAERQRGLSFPISAERPLPDRDFRMVDQIDLLVPDGGPQGLGWIHGSIDVDPGKWFFEAHFYQDPVWPGSLGLEAFVQLLKTYAVERWELGETAEFQTVPSATPHRWGYRGQIVQGCQRVEVYASITTVDDERQTLMADGFLSVDGRTIYSMNDFSLGAR